MVRRCKKCRPRVLIRDVSPSTVRYGSSYLLPPKKFIPVYKYYRIQNYKTWEQNDIFKVVTLTKERRLSQWYWWKGYHSGTDGKAISVVLMERLSRWYWWKAISVVLMEGYLSGTDGKAISVVLMERLSQWYWWKGYLGGTDGRLSRWYWWKGYLGVLMERLSQ